MSVKAVWDGQTTETDWNKYQNWVLTRENVRCKVKLSSSGVERERERGTVGIGMIPPEREGLGNGHDDMPNERGKVIKTLPRWEISLFLTWALSSGQESSTTSSEYSKKDVGAQGEQFIPMLNKYEKCRHGGGTPHRWEEAEERRKKKDGLLGEIEKISVVRLRMTRIDTWSTYDVENWLKSKW